jgi:2-oxoglutarate ferredoxin oxidoreductase subunit gamma
MNDGNLYEEVTMAGFGGQGILMIGKLLAQSAMKSGLEVTYMPSYGAEVRGGTANCMVIVGDEPIACPIISHPDSLIAMNEASLRKFLPRLKSGGLLVLNSSLIETEPERDDLDVISIPADEMAGELKSVRSANMVALGAYLQRRTYLPVEAVAACLPDVFSKRYHKLLSVNEKALRRGFEFAEKR